MYDIYTIFDVDLFTLKQPCKKYQLFALCLPYKIIRPSLAMFSKTVESWIYIMTFFARFKASCHVLKFFKL